ncbi:MAG: formate dehydrogenase accessory sulfurtransferase FdhD [Planctomycetota bacterium]
MARDRFSARGRERDADFVAVEEPLEIRVRGNPLAVLMRLPGRERDLVAGFLGSEGVLRDSGDLGPIEPCLDLESGRPSPNVWNAGLADGVAFDPRERRFGVISSSCGLCGTRTLEDLEKVLHALPRVPAALPAGFFQDSFQRLEEDQEVFRRTAGVHAAALFHPQGACLDVAEDVGRHNAVDKVLGARLREGRYPSPEPAVLLVSGRISFEIVQKAALGGVGVVAGVSAPTSLAIEGAGRFGMTLFGLARGDRVNRYAGRVKLPSPG